MTARVDAVAYVVAPPHDVPAVVRAAIPGIDSRLETAWLVAVHHRRGRPVVLIGATMESTLTPAFELLAGLCCAWAVIGDPPAVAAARARIAASGVLQPQPGAVH